VRLTLGEVAAATDGELYGDASLALDSVVIDSRAAERGALFVALVAERDGHTYVADAFARGACAVLAQQPLGDAVAHVVVPDTLAALGLLGMHARDRLRNDTVVVGITGSTGKTSTKDLTEAAFAAQRRTIASTASFNNEMGVPLTLLRAGNDTDVVICEMGARGRGHIAYLCSIARPTAAAITNIGVAHAELFGTIEETAKAKGELVESLPSDGVAVLNADDPMTPGLAARSNGRVLRAGTAPDADVRILSVSLNRELQPAIRFATPWGEGETQLQMRGAHQAANAAMALALAVANGVALDAALDGMARAKGSAWRMEIARSPRGVVVLNDAYNANPTSVMAALDALAALPDASRRIAVLGTMAELGVRADSEHRKVGEHAARLNLDQIVVVGEDAQPIAEAATAAGATVLVTADAADALTALAPTLRSGDAVLVKASRVVGLERLARALVDDTTVLPA